MYGALRKNLLSSKLCTNKNVAIFFLSETTHTCSILIKKSSSDSRAHTKRKGEQLEVTLTNSILPSNIN